MQCFQLHPGVSSHHHLSYFMLVPHSHNASQHWQGSPTIVCKVALSVFLHYILPWHNCQYKVVFNAVSVLHFFVFLSQLNLHHPTWGVQNWGTLNWTAVIRKRLALIGLHDHCDSYVSCTFFPVILSKFEKNLLFFYKSCLYYDPKTTSPKSTSTGWQGRSFKYKHKSQKVN